jgi:4-amino-4-deoxy-L-arabinose transferase-like glycosyltransferase
MKDWLSARRTGPLTGRGLDVVALAALLALGSCAFLRLMSLPAFEDEGAQLRLIWRMIDKGEWLQPLSGGKPLEVWPMSLLVRLHFQPPLLGIRALHVVSGLLGAVLTYCLALRTSGRRIALASGALFVTCPFVVYLERFALSDILLCTASLWSYVAVISFAESPTRRRAIAMALALCLAAFCKFPVGFTVLAVVPLALLLMPASERSLLLRAPGRARLIAAVTPTAVLAVVVIVVALVQWQRGQSQGFGVHDLMVVGGGHDRAITEAMGVERPGVLSELAAQLSWPVLVLALTGLVASAYSGDWRQRWLVATGLLPLLAIGLFAHFWFSRYLLFALPPLMISAVYGWRRLAELTGRFAQPLKGALLAVALGIMAQQSALLIIDPVRARWSPVDRFQYIEGWGSGYGYPQAARFVLSASDAPSLIYSLDGHSADQLLTYLPTEWTLRVRAIRDAPVVGAAHAENTCADDILRVRSAWIIAPAQLVQPYLLSLLGPSCSELIDLRTIAQFDKPGLRMQVGIYEIVQR